MKAIFNHRKEIDGLRSIAVLTVIFYHANFSWFSGGYIGVDVFFVISGYLISSIIYKECLNESFSFLKFYERRVRRIFPMIFFLLSVTVLFAFLIYSPKELRNFSQSVFSTVTYSSNIYFWKKTGYFSQNIDTIPLIHTWSLAVEEQFYIVYPIIFYLLFRFFNKRLQVGIVIIFLLSIISCLFFFQNSDEFVFFMMPTRAWELMAGTLLALNKKNYYEINDRKGLIHEILSIAGLVLILVATFAFNNSTKYPGPLTILPVLGTCLIINSASENNLLGMFLRNQFVVHIGLISYSAYLIHQPLFVFVREFKGEAITSLEYIILIAITLLISHFTLKLIETPFRIVKYSRRFVFRYALIYSTVLVVIAVAGHIENGFPNRFSESQRKIASFAVSSPMRDKCHTEGLNYTKPSNACRFFEGNTNWAVFGDSHGVELSYALGEKLDSSKQGVIELTCSGCQPAINFESNTPGCSNWTKDALSFLINNKDISNVVLIYRHSFYLQGNQLSFYPQVNDFQPTFLVGKSSNESREVYWNGFKQIIEELIKSGKKVYVIDPVPELGNTIDKYIYANRVFQKEQSNYFGPSLDYYKKRNSFILNKLDDISWNDSLIRIKSSDLLKSTEDNTLTILNGKSLYFDDNHLSVEGATILANKLLKK